jgi:IS30 family transposase
MYSVDIYSRVRRACLKDGMSAREAARYFNKDRKTIAKMLVLSRFSSGLFRAMFAMKEIKNGNEIHRRVSA